jgi:membrane fusion protein (multidrug efflux system)
MRTAYLRNIMTFLLVSVGLVTHGCEFGPPQEPQGKGTPEVVVEVLKQEPVPITTELPGRTSAYLIAEVRPQVSGIIQKRLFTEGDDVKAGQALYQIDPATYEAAYEGAKAGLAMAEANVMSIGSRVQR